MSTQKPLLEFEEGHGFPEEDLREGSGYFRAWLGMQLEDGRYGIMRKLGFGEFSTVWLARDFKCNRYVALKIMTREATSELKAGRTDEIAMLEKIRLADHSHAGYRHLLEYYDTFEITGAEGSYCCIVTEVLGPSLDDLRHQDGNSRPLPLHIFKGSIRQVLLGLDYLHTLCGIIHTDVKFDNIMLRLRDMPSVIEHEIVKYPSKCYGVNTNVPSSPYMVESQPILFDLDSFDSRDVETVVADLGFSHWVHKHFKEIVQPAGLRAPEVILGHPWDQAVDIWAIGCLGIQMIVGLPLHEPDFFDTYRPIEEDHLAQMTDVTGEQFSLAMISKSQHRDRFFNENGTFLHEAAPREAIWPLRQLLAECPALESDEQEMDLAIKFFMRCLQLQPENRPTAKELAEDTWLKLD